MVFVFKFFLFMICSLSLSCERDAGYGLLSADKTYKVFVTQGFISANIGSLVNADSFCEVDINYPGTGTFKAMIVDNSQRIACTTPSCSAGNIEHVNWVFKKNTIYVRDDGTYLFVTNSRALPTTPLNASPDDIPGMFFWTGLALDWTSDSNNCSNWTGTTGNAMLGSSIAKNSDFYSYLGGSPCLGTQKLLCVEQ